MRKVLLFIALCEAAVVVAAHGVPAISATGAASATSARYACGGVGDLEQLKFKNAAPRHDAMLTFATPTGAYVADVDVKITSDRGDVILQVFCAGPLMLVDVPASGRYRISASLNGHLVEKTVRLGDKSARVLFTWPVS